MRLFKRGKVWCYDLQFEGKRYQKSTKERNKVKAESIAAAFRTALANRCVGIVERKPAPLFTDAMTAFLAWSEEAHREHPGTYLRYKVSSKPLLAFLGFKTKTIDEITPGALEEYKTRRGRQKGKHTNRRLKPATVNRELACLKAMFNHALKNRHDFRNPVCDVDFLPENNEQDRILTFEEQRRYLTAAGPSLEDIARLIVETGMRPEEVYKLTADNVSLEQGHLFVHFGKTPAARRRIPLNSAALEVVKRRVQAAKGTYLFPHRSDPNKPTLKASNAHSRALDASKIQPRFRLYDLRHTWATRAAEAGMDMPTLAALLGHSKLNMVLRYVHPQARHQADAVKRLEAVNAAKEIAEVERQKSSEKQPTPERVPTVSTTEEKARQAARPLTH